jgi:hypothetical protein
VFLSSAFEGGEWWDSHSSRFFPAESAPGSHSKGVHVDWSRSRRGGEKKKSLFWLWRELIYDRWVRSLLPMLTEVPRAAVQWILIVYCKSLCNKFLRRDATKRTSENCQRLTWERTRRILRATGFLFAPVFNCGTHKLSHLQVEVLRVVTPCSIAVECNVSEDHAASSFRVKWGSKVIRKVGILPQLYTASQSRRYRHKYSPPWKAQIFLISFKLNRYFYPPSFHYMKK